MRYINLLFTYLLTSAFSAWIYQVDTKQPTLSDKFLVFLGIWSHEAKPWNWPAATTILSTIVTIASVRRSPPRPYDAPP